MKEVHRTLFVRRIGAAAALLGVGLALLVLAGGCKGAGMGGLPAVNITEEELSVGYGEPAVFHLEISGAEREQPAIRWYVDGEELTGETGETLTLVFRPPEATTYTVTAEVGDGGSVSSDEATLKVAGPALSVEIGEGDISVDNGEKVTFTAQVSAPEGVETVLQWFVDDLHLPGETGETLELQKYPLERTTYQVTVECAVVADGQGSSGQGTDAAATDTVQLTVASPVLFDHTLVEETGSFTYTLNLGTAVRDVYFVFTNSSQSTASSAITVTPTGRRNAVVTGSGEGERDETLDMPAAPRVLKDKPEISAFNRDPFAQVGVRTDEAQAARRSVQPPEPNLDVVGDTRSFRYDSWLGNIPATCRKVVSGVSVAQGNPRTLNIWVADDCWYEGGSKARLVSQEMVDILADRFLRAGADNDIYDWVTAIFGPEWGAHPYVDLIWPDDTITILLYDIDGDNSTWGGVLGYFWAKDNFTASAISSSNERIMFSLDAVLLATEDGASWDASDYWPREMLSTLAHEFQHMIHFYQKNVLRVPDGSGTEVWLNEMCSLVTEDLVAKKLDGPGPRGVDPGDGSAGYALNMYGRLPWYAYWDDTPLTDWLAGEDVYKSYATAYAFGAYLARNRGGAPLFGAIVQNQFTGSDAVEAALQSLGYQQSFAEVLRDWGAAVLFSDSTQAPAGLRYNRGDWFLSTAGEITYELGSINLFNYLWSDQPGPYVYRLSPVGAENLPGGANRFYLAGSNLTGVQRWQVSLPAGVRLSVMLKEVPQGARDSGQ